MGSELEFIFYSVVSFFYQMEFEKDRDTKENGDDEEKVKSSENVSIKDGESSEKLPLSDDDDDDDKNNSDSKSSSAPGTDEKKPKPWVMHLLGFHSHLQNQKFCYFILKKTLKQFSEFPFSSRSFLKFSIFHLMNIIKLFKRLCFLFVLSTSKVILTSAYWFYVNRLSISVNVIKLQLTGPRALIASKFRNCLDRKHLL